MRLRSKVGEVSNGGGVEPSPRGQTPLREGVVEESEHDLEAFGFGSSQDLLVPLHCGPVDHLNRKGRAEEHSDVFMSLHCMAALRSSCVEEEALEISP